MNLKSRFSKRQYFLHRHFLVITLIGIVVLFIFWKIISSWYNPILQKQAENQSQMTVIYPSTRGQIFDRNGKLLASNILESKVILEPKNIVSVGFDNVSSIWRIDPNCRSPKSEWRQKCRGKNLANTARALFKNGQTKSEILTSINIFKAITHILKAEEELLVKIIAKKKQGSQYYIAQKKLPFTGKIIQELQTFKREKFLICRTKERVIGIKQIILDFIFNPQFQSKTKTLCKINRIAGILIENSSKRFYPQAPSTTPLIGVVSQKGIGVFGLEKSFNHLFANRYGSSQIKKKNASWDNHYLAHNKLTRNGKDLHLTIDAEVQAHLFNAIQDSVKKYKANSAAGIILNPKGEIIAMASYPTSNPNFGINGVDNYSHYLNRSLVDSIDIASLVKPLIVLMALDKNLITMDEMIDVSVDEGINQLRRKKDIDYISVSDIIKTSNSLGSVKIGKLLSSKEIFSYLNDLKFGHSLGILPDTENIGLLRNYTLWGKADKKRVSFGGYGVINTTLAQIAHAYLIFVNHGKTKNLKLFKNALNQEQQVFKSDDIDDVITAMEKVINDNGTGKLAQLKDVIAAGKTGTAQLLINGKYSNTHHNTLFAGFAPSRSPKYLMIVNIKDPEGYYYDGGSVAAPIFKAVMDKIL